MAKRVFWDRRSGVDRRQTTNPSDYNRRAIDRRQIPNNDYLLVIGGSGLDTFELMVLVPIIAVISAMMLGNFFGAM